MAADVCHRRTPPPGAGQQQLQHQEVVSSRVTALVRKWELDAGVVYVHLRPCCGHHPDDPASPCCQVGISGECSYQGQLRFKHCRTNDVEALRAVHGVCRAVGFCSSGVLLLLPELEYTGVSQGVFY
jgi:hypothetical protein